MGRPREFDTEIALGKAMSLFWDVGYEDASMVDLLDKMEITKGSFYKAFGDKRSIYVEAVDRYDTEMVSLGVAYLTDSSNGTARERIVGLFESAFILESEEKRRLGCFLCNAIVDQAAHDDVIACKLAAMVQRVENAFATALSEPDAEGLVLSERDARKKARGVLTLFIGMRVLGRVGISSDYAADTLEQLKILLGHRP